MDPPPLTAAAIRRAGGLGWWSMGRTVRPPLRAPLTTPIPRPPRPCICQHDTTSACGVQRGLRGASVRENEQMGDAPTPRKSSPTARAGLQANLRAAPVAALGVVADLVVGAHADPLRDRAVLLELLRKRHLRPERLVRRHRCCCCCWRRGSLHGGRGCCAESRTTFRAAPTTTRRPQQLAVHGREPRRRAPASRARAARRRSAVSP